jgi:hypothetical protein
MDSSYVGNYSSIKSGGFKCGGLCSVKDGVCCGSYLGSL